MEHFELSGDVLHRRSQTDDSISRLVIPFGEPHCSESCNGDGRASYCGDDFDHGSIGYLDIVANYPGRVISCGHADVDGCFGLALGKWFWVDRACGLHDQCQLLT